MAVLGPEGTVLWSEPQGFLTAGISLGGEPWFDTVRHAHNVSIVPVHMEREKESLLYMVSPLVRNGEFTGAILGAIDLAQGDTLSPETHPGAHVLTTLATRQGDVVYPPTPPPLTLPGGWASSLESSLDKPFVVNGTLAGADCVVAGAAVQGTNFVLLSLADAGALMGPARARMQARIGLGLLLAVFPLLLLVLLLRRSFRIFKKSEENALRGERLRMLGEAVNLIAHEVKNSLNSLRVALDLALKGDRTGLETRQQRAVAGLRTEMQRLSDFTTELLQFSKGVVPRPVGVDLAEFVPKVTELTRSTAEGLGIQLEVSSSGIRVPVRADPALIHVVIANLLNNAVEALMGRRAPRPSLAVRVAARGAQAQIRVSDNGPGVAEALRPRLFEPFVTGKPSGVGIGLALSRKIARAHGGDLVLETSGPGATFLLTLPVEKP